jgi:hypothetical protein
MDGHHLILGEIDDFISGETLKDTHDERYRQKIARLLVNQKGYNKNDLQPRRKLLVQAGDKKAVVKIDFLINVSDKICMIIKYGPGSIVTRRRPVLAASRILVPYQIPIAVATNGEDAEIIEGSSGKVISRGLETIPSRSRLIEVTSRHHFNPVSIRQADMESRIIYCYEIDGSCPCDEDICRL